MDMANCLALSLGLSMMKETRLEWCSRTVFASSPSDPCDAAVGGDGTMLDVATSRRFISFVAANPFGPLPPKPIRVRQATRF